MNSTNDQCGSERMTFHTHHHCNCIAWEAHFHWQRNADEMNRVGRVGFVSQGDPDIRLESDEIVKNYGK